MARPTFRMDDELIEEVDSRLTYGDSRSEWVRDAIRLKLAIVNEMDEDMTEEQRKEFVVEAIRSADSQ